MKSNGAAAGSDTISSHGLKKGPWTAAEDAILMEYVKKHGEGNWNAVQKNSGLLRCGKSCRLRWANHLRPNLKKGCFSSEEESLIIELHAKLGNKWARMAAQLPGRTDNEIKNYWNTRMKRRQRAGLPIYPRTQQVRDEVAGFVLQQQQHAPQYQGREPPTSSSLSSNFLSSSQDKNEHNYVSSFSLLDSMNSSSSAQTQPIPSFYPNLYNTSNSSNNSGLAPPLPPFVSSSSNLYNQNITAQLPAPSFHYNSGSFEQALRFSSLLMGEPIDFVPGLNAEFPSSQTPPEPTTTHTSSYKSSGSVCVVAALGNTNNIYCEPKGSSTSGLLDDLLVESGSLSHNERNKDGGEFPQVIDKGKGVMDEVDVEEEGKDDGKNCVVEKQWDDLSSSQSSMGVKPSDESIEETNSMDEDLLSLLNNFPSSMPLPEWYTKTTRTSNGSSSGGRSMIECNTVLDAQQNVSPAPAATASLNQALGSCCWKNMPGICEIQFT